MLEILQKVRARIAEIETKLEGTTRSVWANAYNELRALESEILMNIHSLETKLESADGTGTTAQVTSGGTADSSSGTVGSVTSGSSDNIV